MSSPKTPTNASANEEQEEPQSLFKRTLNLFFGSNKKQRTSSAPSSTASSNQIQNETSENGNITRNLNPVLDGSNFTSPVTTSTTNNNMNTTPTVQTPTVVPGVKPFHVGSTTKPTAKTFKKITFRSDVKTPNLKGNSSFSTKPIRKATPFGKQKRVSFGGSNQRTPAKSAITPFRKTPFKANSTPSTVHRRYRSELMSTPLVPSNSTPKTKLGAISQSRISDVAKSIMEQQSTSLSASRFDQQEDELFTNPTEKRQKRALAITKSYGSQGEGSRISKANDIQARRVSAGNGAFRSGPSPKGNDYWSNFQEEEEDVQQQSQTPKPPSARDDNDYHAVKRRKATTTQLSPPNGQTPFKAVKTLSPTSAMKSEEERKPIPFEIAPVENWIETIEEGNYSRDEDGRVNHGTIKMYGNTIELGLGTTALKENSRSKTALKDLRDGKCDGFNFDFSDQTRKVTESESVLPYNFMPTTKSESRKGSSSLLNKPLAQNASKISTTPSSAIPATSSQAPKKEEAESTKAAPTPPSQGWGNLFKKEEGTWTCLTCRSSNPKTASNCLACETPKGEEVVGEKQSEEDTGKNKKEDDSKGPTFCFDNKDSGNTSKFSFGAPASEAASSNASGGFTFGAAKTEDTKGDAPKPVTGGFTFGAASTSATEKKDDAPKPAFSFGAPASTTVTEKKDDAPKPAFSFGAPAPAAATEKKDDAPKPTFSFGAPAPAAATEKKDDAPKPAFSFGAPASTTVTKKKDDAPKPAFSFGAPASTAATEKKDDAPKPAFSFGAPAPATVTEKKDDAPKPAFSFGAAAPGGFFFKEEKKISR
ncbi:hypothetical protein CTEN210_03200 [Chaetoceros tenuissimus]|uniref:RanBP2-type domain-containing protein n=1 Tax=Chaetoceros tenuissimus TaxID=426638 RepID=A0AAD3H125_9STRA|nr:hypothetical protein CTEN210_03200 [Chaetoceros tenuissimus]